MVINYLELFENVCNDKVLLSVKSKGKLFEWVENGIIIDNILENLAMIGVEDYE